MRNRSNCGHTKYKGWFFALSRMAGHEAVIPWARCVETVGAVCENRGRVILKSWARFDRIVCVGFENCVQGFIFYQEGL